MLSPSTPHDSLSLSDRSSGLSRRAFVAGVGATAGGLLAGGLGLPALIGATKPAAEKRPKVAVIFTVCTYRSHAHVILENFLTPYLFNGKKTDPGVDVVSFYADQLPSGDMSRDVAKRRGIPMYKSIDKALCLGGKELAVDAVLSIGEHGNYPTNKKGQVLYPRKRFFDEIVAVMKRSDRFVPLFNDKHLAYRWDWAKSMYDQTQELGIPFMAGSSVPLATRRPPLELPPNAKVTEAVSIHGGPFEGYGIHALEVLQSFVEARQGGESGVKSVQFLQSGAVWEAAKKGLWSLDLAKDAMRAELGKYQKDIKVVEGETSSRAHATLIEYNDGFKATILKLGNDGTRWNFACKLQGKEKNRATALYVGPWSNRNLFKALAHAIQHHFITGKAPYPVERTLLTTGTVEALVQSRAAKGEKIKTDHLAIKYQPQDFRVMREMGETWKIITPDVKEPGREYFK